MRFAPALTPRITDFAPRDPTPIVRLALSQVAANLLIVAAPPNEEFAETCIHLLAALAPFVFCHTVAWDAEFAKAHGESAKQAIPKHQRLSAFFDVVTSGVRGDVAAGENEMRILVWTQRLSDELWNSLVLSRAGMEILVVPSDLAHPFHPGRRLIDTTPYVQAEHLLQRLNS